MAPATIWNLYKARGLPMKNGSLCYFPFDREFIQAAGRKLYGRTATTRQRGRNFPMEGEKVELSRHVYYLKAIRFREEIPWIY